MEPNFFRSLSRRLEYSVRKDGTFYDYKKYRDEIAEDCQFRCVYCDSHEDIIGGREAMELDHFRPWQKKFKPDGDRKFEHLQHEPSNLVHACGVCNGFKWSHWPTEDPDRCFDEEKGWIHPFDNIRADFLEVIESGAIVAKKAPAQYQITKLRLNRPLLKRQREFHMLFCVFSEIEKKWKNVIAHEAGSDHAKTATEALELLSAIRSFIER